MAGYWIIQVKSLAEAIEWIKRCPNPHNEDGEIEIRQIFELDDFGDSAAIDRHRDLDRQARQEEVNHLAGACRRAEPPGSRNLEKGDDDAIHVDGEVFGGSPPGPAATGADGGDG